ncbi:ATP-binding protein [Thermodesulfovibrio hydrogeniphilus]
MKRKIIRINEEKCTGCGLCAEACHEKAIEIVNGKARLVSEEYCDGLGACLPACPEGAIEIIEAEAKPFNAEAVKERLKKMTLPCGCPSSHERVIKREPFETSKTQTISQLTNWPIQLKLVNPYAKFLNNAELLIAADCTAFAYASIHGDFIKGKVTIIGCPKLDDTEFYLEKLTEIFKANSIKGITILRMEVPCCGGLTYLVEKALSLSSKEIPVSEYIITINGEIIKQKEVCHVL